MTEMIRNVVVNPNLGDHIDASCLLMKEKNRTKVRSFRKHPNGVKFLFFKDNRRGEDNIMSVNGLNNSYLGSFCCNIFLYYIYV